MSLIGEALKRARLEAARRDAEERGAVYSEAPAYQPQRRGLARWPAAGLLLGGLALGVVVGSGIFLALRQAPAKRPEPAAPAEPSVPPVAAPATGSVTPAAPASPPEPAAAPDEQPAAPGPAKAAPAAESAPAGAPRPSSAEKAPVAAPPGPRAEPRPATSPLVSGRSYLRTVELPSGGRLELDGIVASADSPLTMINRQLLGPGESIEGFTVERIEPNQVTLRRDGTVVVLRLRDLPAG